VKNQDQKKRGENDKKKEHFHWGRARAEKRNRMTPRPNEKGREKVRTEKAGVGSFLSNTSWLKIPLGPGRGKKRGCGEQRQKRQIKIAKKNAENGQGGKGKKKRKRERRGATSIQDAKKATRVSAEGNVGVFWRRKKRGGCWCSNLVAKTGRKHPSTGDNF